MFNKLFTIVFDWMVKKHYLYYFWESDPFSTIYCSTNPWFKKRPRDSWFSLYFHIGRNFHMRVLRVDVAINKGCDMGGCKWKIKFKLIKNNHV